MRIRTHWQDLTRHDQWAIGVVEAPIHRFLDAGFRPAVRWLAGRGRTGYHADPFGWGGGVFCEDWDAAQDLGRLAWLGPDGRARPLGGFPPGKHHSYPYVFEQEGALYCVPESWQTGAVHLYRAVRPPLDWVREGTLLSGVAAADPTLFRHEGRWWLAYSDQWAGAFSTLYLWHAAELGGPWKAHAKNPVKCDLGSARPAGTPFWHAGSLYRPGQDCRASYGCGIAIHRIVRLTPEEFEEELAVRRTPDPSWPWPDGLHTLSAWGERTLLDAKRVTFLPAEAWRVLKRKAGRVG